MKVINSYILKSVLFVGFVSLMILSFIYVTVILFINLESFIQNEISIIKIFYFCLLSFPEAIIKSLGLSFLFSITYFFSMMYANNEIIALYNAGISLNRIKTPILLISLLLLVFTFAFNEIVSIPLTREKNLFYNQLIGISNNYDNRNITLSNQQNNFVIYANRYTDKTLEISNCIIVFTDENNALKKKIVSQKGKYDTLKEEWTFYNNQIYEIDGNNVIITYQEEYFSPLIDTEPQIFKNLTNDVKTMSLPLALNYIRKIRFLNPDKYSQIATDFYQRLFECLSPLVMIIIACSVNYKFKKNVLLFSVLSCICVAVVYYVVQMLTLILAHQGIIQPALGSLFPFAFILLFTILSSRLLRKL